MLSSSEKSKDAIVGSKNENVVNAFNVINDIKDDDITKFKRFIKNVFEISKKNGVINESIANMEIEAPDNSNVSSKSCKTYSIAIVAQLLKMLMNQSIYSDENLLISILNALIVYLGSTISTSDSKDSNSKITKTITSASASNLSRTINSRSSTSKSVNNTANNLFRSSQAKLKSIAEDDNKFKEIVKLYITYFALDGLRFNQSSGYAKLNKTKSTKRLSATPFDNNVF
ncbi:MAG: hypothetical protein MHPSP_000968 [Paramarteilia canceri]